MGEEEPKKNSSTEVTLSVNHQVDADASHDLDRQINNDKPSESGQVKDITVKAPVTQNSKPPPDQKTLSNINVTNNGCNNMPSSSKALMKSKPSRPSRERRKKSKEESIIEIEKVKEKILQKLEALGDEELEMDDDGRTLEIMDQLRRKLVKIEAELLKHVVYEDAEYGDLQNENTNAHEKIIITNTELTPLNDMLTKYINILPTREDRRARYRCATYAKVKEMLEEIQSKGDCSIFDAIVPKELEQYDLFIAKVVEEVNFFCRMKRMTDLVEIYGGNDVKSKDPHPGEDNITDESAKEEVDMKPSLPHISLGQKFMELVKRGELGNESEEVNEKIIDLSDDDLVDDEEIEDNEMNFTANTTIVGAELNDTNAVEQSSSVNVSPSALNKELDRRNDTEDGDDQSMSGLLSPVSVIELEGNSEDEDECCSCTDDDDDDHESDSSSIECVMTEIKSSVKEFEKKGEPPYVDNNNESELTDSDSLKIVGEMEKSAKTIEQGAIDRSRIEQKNNSIIDVNETRATDSDSIKHLKTICVNSDKRKSSEEFKNSESKRARHDSAGSDNGPEVIDIDSDEEEADDEIQVLYEDLANKIIAKEDDIKLINTLL